MKNFIKSIKMIRYGLQFKMMIILTLVFFGLGVAMEFTLSKADGGSVTSGLYMAIAGVYVYQLILTSSVSTLVQTSSMKRGLQTAYPAIFTGLTSTFSFTIFVIIRVCRINSLGGKDFDDFTLASSKGILGCGILVAVLALYMGICYKHFIISIILLSAGVAVVILTGSFGRFAKLLNFANDMSLGTIIGLSYCLVLAGWILCWLASVLLYRKAIDTMSVRAALRQAEMK